MGQEEFEINRLVRKVLDMMDEEDPKVALIASSIVLSCVATYSAHDCSMRDISEEIVCKNLDRVNAVVDTICEDGRRVLLV